MKCDFLRARACFLLPFVSCVLFSSIISPASLRAQEKLMQKNEQAACVIKINNAADKSGRSDKIYNVIPNRVGLFKRVAAIKPSEKLSIEIIYPFARTDEKVVVNVLDGGRLDNGKGVKILSLGHRRNCVFGFQVSDDLGLYRLLVRKGNDTKIVQIWVGPEPAVARN